MSDSISDSIDTTGRITVGSSVTGAIETPNDRDAYAVDLVAGRTYRIDLEGVATDKGTLADPFLRWLRDETGTGLVGTRDDNGGAGDNARQTFTPEASGTYYISARGKGNGVGTYTVTVTDTTPPEPPVFGASAYAFELAENADGSTERVSLGTVTAIDPEGATLAYGLVGGNLSGSFEIDASTGELFYKGAGEDYESDATSFTLTVRASDGSLHADTTVTVNVTDVNEAPAFAETSYAFDLAENADGSTNRVSLGTVAATDPERTTLAYRLVGGNESGSFEIDATSGELFYKGSGEDFESGTTQFTLTVRASDGSETADTTVTVNVTDVEEGPSPEGATAVESVTLLTADTDATRAGATDLGDITALRGPRFPLGTLEGSVDRVDYYRFTLTEAKRVGLGLRQQDADANLYLEDADGTVLYSSTNSGTDNERIAETLLAGTYYLRVESQAAGLNAHRVRYGVSAPDADALAALQEQSGTAVNAAPAFGHPGYAFALAENADGSTNRVSLGTVAATDPEGTTLAYRLVGGNESGSFEIDENTGELFYIGAREDFESGTAQFTLTVRASDGSETADTTVTVNVTDVEEDAGTSLDGESAEPPRSSVSEAADADLPGDVTTTGVVATDGTVTGKVESTGDRDWFAVDLRAGVPYRIELKGVMSGGGTLVDPHLYGIHDSEGTLLAGTENDDASDTTIDAGITFTPTETGTYYVAAGAGGRWTGTYTLTVVEVVPAVRTADAEAHEEDGTVVFRVTLSNASSNTVEVAYATADGTATAGEDYTATSGTLTFAPGETEKTVAVTIIDDTVEDSGETFSLVLSDPSGAVLEDDAQAVGTILNTEDDHPDDITSAKTDTDNTVTVGTHKWGKIEEDNDMDWFQVELTAGKLYQIDVRGEEQHSVGADMVYDMHLHGIYDSAENLLPGTEQSNAGWWLSPRLYFDPPATGTYYIALGSNWGTGNYRLTVTDKGADQSADTSTTGTVAVNGTATGVIPGTGDQDWFKVSLTAGTAYRIGIDARDGGQAGWLSDPALLGIHEADGDLIANTYDDDSGTGGIGRNSLLEFTPTTTGDHFIAVGYGEYSLCLQSMSGPGGGFGGYTVSVDEVDAM